MDVADHVLTQETWYVVVVFFSHSKVWSVVYLFFLDGFFFFFCLYGSVKTSLLILCLKVCKDVIYILLDCGDESFMLESYFK